ncbi:MAG: hypothetical protein AB8B61_04510 [Cyclobacteriaceae bacterium]
MSEIKISDKAKEKLKPIDLRFLEAVEVIKKEAVYRDKEPSSDMSFQRMIEANTSTMTNIRIAGRSVTVQQLIKTAIVFGIDFNWFVRKEAPFYYQLDKGGKKVSFENVGQAFSADNINSDGFFGNVQLEKKEGEVFYQQGSGGSTEGSLLVKENVKLKEELTLCTSAYEGQQKEIQQLKELLANKSEQADQLKDRVIILQEQLIKK